MCQTLGYSDVTQSRRSLNFSVQTSTSSFLINPSVLLPQHTRHRFFWDTVQLNMIISLCLSVCFPPLYHTNINIRRHWVLQALATTTVWQSLSLFFWGECCISSSEDLKCKLLWVIMTVTLTVSFIFQSSTEMCTNLETSKASSAHFMETRCAVDDSSPAAVVSVKSCQDSKLVTAVLQIHRSTAVIGVNMLSVRSGSPLLTS